MTLADAAACEAGNNIDLTAANISISYDITAPNPPTVAIGSTSTVKIELFTYPSSKNIKELDYSGKEKVIYSPTGDNIMSAIKSDFNINGKDLEIVIHYDSESEKFHIYSSTKETPVAKTSSMMELGFNDAINSVQVTVQQKGNAQCKILKRKLQSVKPLYSLSMFHSIFNDNFSISLEIRADVYCERN
jgi:hypothetical protein